MTASVTVRDYPENDGCCFFVTVNGRIRGCRLLLDLKSGWILPASDATNLFFGRRLATARNARPDEIAAAKRIVDHCLGNSRKYSAFTVEAAIDMAYAFGQATNDRPVRVIVRRKAVPQ